MFEKPGFIGNALRRSKVGQNQFAWPMEPQRDPYLHLNIRRSTLIAFLASLLVHLLVLFAVPRQRLETGEPIARPGDSLLVNLRPRVQPPAPQVSSTAIPESRPAPVVRRQPASADPVIALNTPRTKDPARPVSPVAPLVPSPPVAEAPSDLQSYVNAARERRRAATGVSGRESTEAFHEREPSEDEIRMALVKRNLTVGTNGIFQILSIESRTAAFSFRGWTTDSSNFRREYIQVEIGTNSSIEIAIVRKMIELIRRYFKGNFNWESQRLDRVVVLSARPEDNEGLEAFLMKEFFETRSPATRVR